MDGIRDELLLILKYVKGDNKKIWLSHLLDRFRIDIERKLEDIEYQRKQLLDNLETLKYVKKEIESEED